MIASLFPNVFNSNQQTAHKMLNHFVRIISAVSILFALYFHSFAIKWLYIEIKAN